MDHEAFPLNVNVKQKLDIRIDQAIKTNNKNLVTRTMNNNENRDSIILEKNVAQKEFEKNKF